MTNMKIFKSIQKFKEKGLSNRKIAKKLGCDRETVAKFRRMKLPEYISYKESLSERDKLFEKFKEEILKIYQINEGKKVYVSSVFDVLEERHGDLLGTERTLRNYINHMVITGEIKTAVQDRKYIPVPDQPPGKQLQLDFGVYTQPNGIKIFIFAAILSNSRIRYAAVQETPFKSMDVIFHLINCFEFIGGIPREIVIDQDRTMVVSENHGDIILTEKFKYFKEEMGFELYVCRAADPESKGKVENLVKFIKTSFFSARIFDSFEDIPDSLSRWLERKANGRICQSTLQIPAVAIETERKHLNTLRKSIFCKADNEIPETRKVGKESLIHVFGSRYSVPEDYRNSEVGIKTDIEILFIFDLTENVEIARHKLALLPGETVINRHHYRDNIGKVKDKFQNLLLQYDLPEWKTFVNKSYRKYQRYFRDQIRLANRFILHMNNMETLKKALQLSIDLENYSFSQLYEGYRYYTAHKEEERSDIIKVLKPILTNISIKERSRPVTERKISYYSSLLKIITTTIGGII